ncbi:MAG: hypothetical protein ACRBHB_09650 [Arenicella sp.]
MPYSIQDGAFDFLAVYCSFFLLFPVLYNLSSRVNGYFEKKVKALGEQKIEDLAKKHPIDISSFNDDDAREKMLKLTQVSTGENFRRSVSFEKKVKENIQNYNLSKISDSVSILSLIFFCLYVAYFFRVLSGDLSEFELNFIGVTEKDATINIKSILILINYISIILLSIFIIGCTVKTHSVVKHFAGVCLHDTKQKQKKISHSCTWHASSYLLVSIALALLFNKNLPYVIIPLFIFSTGFVYLMIIGVFSSYISHTFELINE